MGKAFSFLNVKVEYCGKREIRRGPNRNRGFNAVGGVALLGLMNILIFKAIY